MARVSEDTGPHMLLVIATDVVIQEVSGHPSANSGVGNQLKDGIISLVLGLNQPKIS